jgi:hypothetical protein
MPASVGGGEMGRPASLAVQQHGEVVAAACGDHSPSGYRGIGHSVLADQCADWDVADIRRAQLAAGRSAGRGRRRRGRRRQSTRSTPGRPYGSSAVPGGPGWCSAPRRKRSWSATPRPPDAAPEWTLCLPSTWPAGTTSIRPSTTSQADRDDRDSQPLPNISATRRALDAGTVRSSVAARGTQGHGNKDPEVAVTARRVVGGVPAIDHPTD